MAQNIKLASNLKKLALEKIKKSLSEQHECYVLITCGSPTKEGNMEVELSYSGDESLAAFLVDNAAQVFSENQVPKK